MPTNFTPEQAARALPGLTLTPPGPTPVTLGEQIRSALVLENVPVSALNALSQPSPPPVEGFDVEANLAPGEDLILEEFAGVRSLDEMQAVRRRLSNEQEARRLLGTGPLPEFLAVTFAILTDPTTYIPLGGALLRSGRFGKRLVAGAAAGVGAVGVAELSLQATQRTRTPEQTAAAILMGGAFGLGLGALGAKLGARQAKLDKFYAAAVKDTKTIMRADFPESTAGAASYRALRPEDTKLARGGQIFAKLLPRGLIAPGLELLGSRFPKAREMALRLTDPGLVTEGMVRGLSPGAGIETRIKVSNAIIRDVVTIDRAMFREHQKNGGRLKRTEFQNEVGKAMRRGDDSSVPEAAKAARNIRKNVYDPLLKEAKVQGLLPEDVTVKTALTYFNRVYNRAAMRARPDDFLARVEAWLRNNIPEEAIAAEAEYRDIASDIMDTILGNPAGRIPFVSIPRLRGPLKERTFLIPDEEILPFLESNVIEVSSRYVRTMVTEIEFAREFGKADVLDDILQDLNLEVRAEVAAAKGAKEKAAIQAEGERQSAVIEGLYNNVRGTVRAATDPAYEGLRRMGKFARTLNFTRLLGQVLLSSIPDVGILVMNEGLARTFGALVTDMATGFKATRMALREAQSFGTALDMYNSQRIRAIMDLGDRFVSETRFENAVDRAGQAFGNIALINQWNTMMKGVTSMVVTTRILRTVERLAAGKKVSKGDLTRLARSRISEEQARRIAGQAEHWERNGDITLANIEAWTDSEAKAALRNAVLTDVDNTIITPGAADSPLWTTTEWGKTVFQFKKFAMASTQRILISGVQMRDAAALNGLMVMVGMGVLGTHLRDVVANRDKDRTPLQWINEGVDRAGVATMFYEFDALSEKFLGASPTKFVTGEPVSRFASRGRLSQLLGPTAGLLIDASDAATGFVKGDVVQSDLHRLRRLVPAQNHFALRALLDQVEAGAARALGIPKKQPRKKRTSKRGLLPTP